MRDLSPYISVLQLLTAVGVDGFGSVTPASLPEGAVMRAARVVLDRNGIK